MEIFSRLSYKGEIALVFDIRSSSVGGALFRRGKNGLPEIIFSVREPIIMGEELDIGKFFDLTLKSLDITASKISKKGLGAPKEIYCVLSSPWHASQIRTIRFSKNTPFIFSTKLADSLAEKEVSLFEEEHSAMYRDFGDKMERMEFKNMKTALNGYAMEAPSGKKATDLEMSVFISMSGERILKKIREAIQRHFHSENLKFCSFIMASFTAGRDMFPEKQDFLLVDISGEIVDISMVKKDMLRESVSYPSGINFIIRRVAGIIGVTIEEAGSLISLYKDGHVSLSAERRLEPAINKAKAEWLGKFQESLAGLSTDVSIPSTIILTVDRDFSDFFSEIIKKEQFNQYTFTESKFQIIFLGTEKLHGALAFTEGTLRDPFLSIESVYINRFLW